MEFVEWMRAMLENVLERLSCIASDLTRLKDASGLDPVDVKRVERALLLVERALRILGEEGKGV